MTNKENQIYQVLSTVFVAIQNLNMPMTEQNLQMMTVAQNNVKGILKLLQENNEKDNKNEADKTDENKN